MTPALPFWLRQRQVKAEPAGDHALRLTAPNLPAYELQVRQPGAAWSAALLPAEGDRRPIHETAALFDTPAQAWEAAFELYRQRVIV